MVEVEGVQIREADWLQVLEEVYFGEGLYRWMRAIPNFNDSVFQTRILWRVAFNVLFVHLLSYVFTMHTLFLFTYFMLAHSTPYHPTT